MELTARARESMPRGVPMAWMDDLYEHPPVWIAHGDGPSFTDVDGQRYLDMYVADLSAFCGHGPQPVVEAVTERIERGNQFLLPSEDAIAVAEHLAGRYGMAKWQFTLSATQANTEVIRLARELTGREIILAVRRQVPRRGRRDARDRGGRGGGARRAAACRPGSPARRGSSSSTTSPRSSAALEPGDVALVLAEPAMTNAGFLLPERRISRGAPGGDPRNGHAARDRRDAHPRLRLRRARPRLGPRAGPADARQVDRGGRAARGVRDERGDRLR